MGQLNTNPRITVVLDNSNATDQEGNDDKGSGTDHAYGALFSILDGNHLNRPLRTFIVPEILPESFDLRTDIAVPYPKIHDQRTTSSCTAFASVAALECTSRRQKCFPIWNLSPSYLYYMLIANQASSAGQSAVPGTLDATVVDGGASLASAMDMLERGVAPLSSWPISKPWNMTPDVKAQDLARLYQATKDQCVRLEQSLDQFRTVLAAGFSILCSIVVTDNGDEWMHSVTRQRESNFLYPTAWGQQDLPKVKYAHSVLIVGYNGLARHFIIRNSWGARWGIDGHFYVAYGAVTEKFWCRDFYAVLQVNENY